MNLWRLVTREILHRKLSAFLGLLSVTAAVACLVGAAVLLEGHDQGTERVLARKGADLARRVDELNQGLEKELAGLNRRLADQMAALKAGVKERMDRRKADTRKRMAALNEAMRKATLKLGFNVVILPKGLNLTDWFAEDYAAKYMPEEYVHRLAKSKIVTVQHLLPSLQQKFKWPEARRTVILIGTRGEVPLLHKSPKKPLVQPVPKGTVVLGHELHDSLGLKAGDTVKLKGRAFRVHKCYPARGTQDDITAWLHLSEAQELLGKKGLINAILALECRCAWSDLPKVRKEIQGILPDTQVIEKASKALARAEIRQKAEDEARESNRKAEEEGQATIRKAEEDAGAALRRAEDDGRAAILRVAARGRESVAREREGREELGRQRKRFAAVLGLAVLLASALWIGFLTFGNVRERRAEIGILRALGVRSRAVLFVFLSRSLLVGAAGGIAGSLVGLFGGMRVAAAADDAAAAGDLVQPWVLAAALLLAPCLSLVASWIPARRAAFQDPADILRGE